MPETNLKTRVCLPPWPQDPRDHSETDLCGSTCGWERQILNIVLANQICVLFTDYENGFPIFQHHVRQMKVTVR